MSEDHHGPGQGEAGDPSEASPPGSILAGSWSPADDPRGLLERAGQAQGHSIELGGGRAVVVYGDDGGDELRRLEGTLRSLAQVPEIAALEAIYVVDEIGRFLAANGEARRAVEALPLDGGAKLLLYRQALGDDDALEALFDRLVRRERLARAAHAGPAGRGASMGAEESGHNGPAPRRYQGRTVIDRDGQISGGVYLSSDGDRPAIVVDHARDHRLRRLYRELVTTLASEHRSGVWRSLSGHFRARQFGEESEEHRVLRYVHATVREHLPPWQREEHGGRTVDEEVMTAIAERGEPVRAGQKIYLGEYLRIATADGIGGGEGMHRSLLAAHLLERLLEDGHLEGSVSFEHEETDDGDMQTWVRFVGRHDTAWVVDTTREYVGPVDTAPSPIYLRSDDVEALRHRPL